MKASVNEKFDALANRHRDAVYAQLVRLCSSREDAEDSLVEALVRAHEAIDTLRDEEAFRGWLAKIARRVCFRLTNRTELRIFEEIVDQGVDPQLELESNQLKHCLLEAVNGLSDKLHVAYTICDLEEVKESEAAERLNISLAALKSRLHRARTHLRTSLENSFCADESFST